LVVPENDSATPGSLTTGALVDSTDTTNAAGYTVTLNNVYGYNFTGGGNASGNSLIDGIAYPLGFNAGPPPVASTFSINGLTAGDTYNLYVYAADGANNIRATEINVEGGGGPNEVTGGQGLFSNTPTPGAWTSGLEYTEFTGTVGESGIITVDFTAPSGGAAVNGLQFEESSLSVPEPSVTILLGLGLLSLVVLRRARRIS